MALNTSPIETTNSAQNAHARAEEEGTQGQPQKKAQWVQAAALVASALIGYKGQRDANKANEEQARRQMEFQERMSNTSYQRGIEDMTAAGLNPMLAYSQGGASAPGGAQATMQNELGAGVASAQAGLGMAQQLETIQQTQAQTAMTQAQTDQVKSTTYEKELNNAIRLAELEKGKLGNLIDVEKLISERFGAATAQEVFRAMADKGPKDNQVTGFQADVDRRKAESRAAQLGLAEQEAMSKYWTQTGTLNPTAQMILRFIETLSGASYNARRR